MTDYAQVIDVPNYKFKPRKRWHTDDARRISAAARIHNSDLDLIDRAATLIGCTRNDLILSSATSFAKSYLEQRQG